MTTALILGAGGTVGMAYHAGVLKALADAGFDPATADLVVGTSAGAIMGSLLRAGHGAEELWDASQGRHPVLSRDEAANRATVRRWAWRSPLGFARRVAGASWVLSRAVVRWPPVVLPAALGRIYPGNLASGTQVRTDLAESLGEAWPDEPLWLCTVDIVSGKRVVLGYDGPSALPLPDAARASAAVPGFYPPVRHGRRLLVDGGAHSTTNADLAAKFGADRAIVAVPMGYEPGAGLSAVEKFSRRLPMLSLRREMAALERAGVDVVQIRPSAEMVRAMGLDLMRPDGLEPVAAMARQDAARCLVESGVDLAMATTPALEG